MIPEETGEEGSEPSHGSPPELLSLPPCPCSAAQGQTVPSLLPLTPQLGSCALGPSMPMSHGLYTCTCPLQDVAVATQVPCLPRSRPVSPTVVPQPVYRAATSKVRFKVRNL